MKKKHIITAFLSLFLCSCTQNTEELKTSVLDFSQKEKNILIIVGEGGPSGNMFVKAVDTYKKEHGGVSYEVHSGDEMVSAINNFVENYGKIDHFQYFGHGNNVGFYVNQAPGVNGAFYYNDPELNKDYIAASLYELKSDIFNEHAWIKFNGCNVAEGYPEKNTLAQAVANYFDVDVVAPRGPTEFSTTPYRVSPIENSNYLDPDFSGDVYMVSTYADKDFIVVRPQEVSDTGVHDLRKGQVYEEAVVGLLELGLNIEMPGGLFLPYKNINYNEAKEFCRTVFGDEEKCHIEVSDQSVWIRNLKALKMLTDASGVSLKYTDPWYNSYIWWANNEGLLTDNFTNKKWYTRAEMAELAWNFYEN